MVDHVYVTEAEAHGETGSLLGPTSLSGGLPTQGSPPYQTTGPDRIVTSQHSLELSRGSGPWM